MRADVSFPEFFKAVHGHGPFPWQAALAERLLAGEQVDVVDVPTGLGKTAVIDVFVWLAAVTGCEPDSHGRRRTFFVIDRRIVVDDAYAHADRLARALHDGHGACGPVAAALRDLAGAGPDEPALVVERMRGGITREWRWLDRPDRAAVVVATADQLGSRLLFRAYGLRPELAPIDAALVGTDSTIVVDEAHLTRPLVETLRRLQPLDRATERLGLAFPRVLQMSATVPAPPHAVVHRIERPDEENDTARRRLHAAKHLHLVELNGSAASRGSRAAGLLAELGRRLVADADGPVAVVCNTVARARAVFDALSEEVGGPEVHLLTGRIRGWDRRRVEARVRALAGLDTSETVAPPSIIVATQTIEVGANLDFAGLVTESASWDALVQRFGRLNRGGHRERATAVVVHDGLPSFTYGTARDETWRWLASLPGAEPVSTSGKAPDLDGSGMPIGPSALRALTEGVDVGPLVVEPTAAPALPATHLDTWVQTSPVPTTSPPPAPFIHGYGRPNDDVQLVWRSDLPQVERVGDEETLRRWADLVDAVPPTSDERLAVPLPAFRRWIRGLRESAADIDDVRGAEPDDDGADRGTPQEVSALRWRGPDDAQLLLLPRDLYRVRPDDTLVLPSTIGGCDRYGWAPGSTEAVPDIGDLASRTPTLRLLPGTTLVQTLETAFDAAGVSDAWDVTRPAIDELVSRCTEAWEQDDPAGVRDVAVELWRLLPAEVVAWLEWREVEPVPRVSLGNHDRSPSAVARFRSPTGRSEARFTSDVGGDPASTSVGVAPVTLEAHQAAVAARARAIGTNLRLPPGVVDAVVEAAAWHDVGKVDPRFQVMLHAGDDVAAEVALEDGVPLAKSGIDPADRALFRRAFVASGLPRGFRHEVGSAAAVAAALEAKGLAVDHELVRHLVGAHHGRGRPLFPAVCDGGSAYTISWEGVEIEHDPRRAIDWDGPRRFAELNRRYGRWGLALLETIVRLADIGCSEEGT